MVYFALVIPPLLMVLTLVMERVEQPLRAEAVSDDIATWLDRAGPEEIESFVSEGLSPSLDRYWRRRARGARTRALRMIRH
jgi:hypothetical protein